MNTRAIRNWLILKPRPFALKCKCADGVHELEVDPNSNWTKLAESVEAIDPDQIELFDRAGKLIRAAKRDMFDDPDQNENEASNAVAKLALDAESARFKIFADHLAGAYQFATQIAFDKMVDLFAAVNRRSEALEKSLDATHRLLGKAYQEQVDQALENAENADPGTQLVGALLNGAAQGQIEKAMSAAQSPSNGKAKAKA